MSYLNKHFYAFLKCVYFSFFFFYEIFLQFLKLSKFVKNSKIEKNFFSKKLHMYFISRKLFIDIIETDVSKYESCIQSQFVLDNKSEGRVRGIFAQKSAIYVFT